MRATLLGFAVAVAGVAGTVPATTSRAQVPPKPNILFILTDDQRAEQMNVMSSTIANFNVKVSPYVVVDPWCCPSRAAILTGNYPHRTGVIDNTLASYDAFTTRETSSLGPWLQANGYYTGFVGKYFNGFAPKLRPAPPGWDEFYGGGLSSGAAGSYSNFTLRQRWVNNGTLVDEIVDYSGSYSTTVFANLADRFIARAEDPLTNPTGKPWALFVWTQAPHVPYTPEPAYATAPVPSWTPPPSALEPDMTDKPTEVLQAPVKVANLPYQERIRREQLRTLMSVDDMVERLFAQIDRLGLRSSTWGIYSSDNGTFLGEHRLGGKWYAYEEAIRVPFRMAIPGMSAQTVNALVSNVDIAPTLLDIAGDTTSRPFDGMSIADVLGGQVPSRTAELLEGFPGEGLPPWFRYDGLRTRRYKYIRWESGNVELYDLNTDPFELNNIASLRPSLVTSLQSKVEELKQ
jgi:arylsulfatase A-like enzyme